MAKDRGTDNRQSTQGNQAGLAPPAGRARPVPLPPPPPENETITKGAAPPFRQSTSVVTRVRIEVPISPPIENGLHSESNPDCARVEVRLEIAESRIMRRMMEGLQTKVTRLRNGKVIASYADVVRWLMEQAVDQVQHQAAMEGRG